MVYSALFYLVFISQIVVISFYLPRKLVKLAMQDAAASRMGLQPGTGRKLSGYTRMNHLIVALGLVLLAAFIFFDLTTSVTAVLASIGAYFLLQLFPLAMPAVRQMMRDMKATYSQTPAHREPTPDSGRLLDTVSPLQVGIALGLSAIWLVIKLLEWNGEMNAQLLNIGIFVGGHLFTAALVARNLRVLKRGGAGQNGCDQFPECYWPDFFMNVSVGSLSPEITIPFTFEAYVLGQDAAMQHILETHGSDSVRQGSGQ